MLACFSVKLPILALFFKFTCLFLQNNLASLYLLLRNWSSQRSCGASQNERANGYFSDASLELLHLVSIIATCRTLYVVILHVYGINAFVNLQCALRLLNFCKFYLMWWTVCEICDEPEWRCWPGVSHGSDTTWLSTT